MFPQTVPHTFHIPVMGLGFTIDTPLKVARYGISSAVSIMEDELIEQMRLIHCRKLNIPYHPIKTDSEDYRANRIRAYLDLMNAEIKKQIRNMSQQPIEKGSDSYTYFELLPFSHSVRKLFEQMKEEEGESKYKISQELLSLIVPGKIDVNIMTKVDKTNYDKEGNPLPRIYSDALSALRGFAQSTLESSVIFSAGLNPALYSYLEEFPDFFPDENGYVKKNVILKVSDYRSAMIQGRFLAKKGIFVSEFRIESGLNCGGHAFATEGLLLGPIMEEFKINRVALNSLLLEGCQQALHEKGKYPLSSDTKFRLTVQGGIGTASENKFLMDYYEMDGTGWGSPFLLVPEATQVDQDTLQKLIHAKKSDYYLSHASPLGVPFNNLKTSSSEQQRKDRIVKNRPGSPCYKKFLSFNTEFTKVPICSASRQYQHLKLKQLKALSETGEGYEKATAEITEKDCLCEGLGAPALLNNGVTPARNLTAVTICPGPNLAYFSSLFSLREMVDHIYGKASIMIDSNRPHMFIKELELYVQYLKNDIEKYVNEQPPKFGSYIKRFRDNLFDGIQYYQHLIADAKPETEEILEKMKSSLLSIKQELEGFAVSGDLRLET